MALLRQMVTSRVDNDEFTDLEIEIFIQKMLIDFDEHD